MVTATQTKLAVKPQMPRPEWVAPLTRRDIDMAADDAAYASFQRVSRFVGAWSSTFPAERRGYYLIEAAAEVFIPLHDDLPGEAAGDARVVIEQNGRTIDFEFQAKLVGIVAGFARYEVSQVHPDREYLG
jgi:hypothetical protein